MATGLRTMGVALRVSTLMAETESSGYTGFVELQPDGTAAATVAATSDATAARMAAIPQTKFQLEQGPSRDILSSITLVWACTEALPHILTGAVPERYARQGQQQICYLLFDCPLAAAPQPFAHRERADLHQPVPLLDPIPLDSEARCWATFTVMLARRQDRHC